VISKKIGGQTYYYLAESARVDGKPRIVSQRYLGRAEDIAAAVEGATAVPERTQHLAFGALAAVWSVLARLDVIHIVDEVVGTRGDPASVGAYLALAIANRVVAPSSRESVADWWASTAGNRWIALEATALAPGRFWDAMEAITDGHLVEIAHRVGAAVVDRYDVDPAGLMLGITNFAPFTNAGSPSVRTGPRGQAKHRRDDLRPYDLTLVVTRDGGIPLLSRAYPSARPGSGQFTPAIEDLVARYKMLTGSVEELTLVFDHEGSSTLRQSDKTNPGLHYVGGLALAQHPDVLSLPPQRFRLGDPLRFGGLTAHEVNAHVDGAARRMILTYSPTLHARQASRFNQALAKAHHALTDLQARLASGYERRDLAAVQAEVSDILHPRWVHRILSATLAERRPDGLRMTVRVDPRARVRLESEIFGKRILVTDHAAWSVPAVIAAHLSLDDAQTGFRQLKDPHAPSFPPVSQWTDQKIQVQILCTVLALTVAQLMRRESARHGLHLSVRELLHSLATIQETVLVYPSTGGRPKTRRLLTDSSSTATQLAHVFNVDTYAPNKASYFALKNADAG
jgi:hypothetical protein